MWKTLLLATGAVTAFTGGRRLASNAPTPVVYAHEDGNNGMFSVDVTPRDGSSEVDILVVNEHSKRAWVSLAIEVVDDRGVAVMPARRLPPFAVDERAAAPEVDHALPRTLADGYYLVRVTASLSDGDQSQTKTTTEYLHVHDGERSWITGSEFYRDSNAVLGTQLAEVRR
jgi:hypothetical protein